MPVGLPWNAAASGDPTDRDHDVRVVGLSIAVIA
jgi:hypothetical protein